MAKKQLTTRSVCQACGKSWSDHPGVQSLCRVNQMQDGFIKIVMLKRDELGAEVERLRRELKKKGKR